MDAERELAIRKAKEEIRGLMRDADALQQAVSVLYSADSAEQEDLGRELVRKHDYDIAGRLEEVLGLLRKAEK
jgi:hypothetical protein